MSEPKTQESPEKSKTAGPSGDLRTRNTTDSSQTHEKTVAEISMRDFLDFLKISYQVNEAIDNPSFDVTEKGSVDWKKLTSDALVGRLKEREALLSKQKTETPNEESQEKPLSSEKNRRNKAQQNVDEKPLENVTAILSAESLLSTASVDRKSASDKLSVGRKKLHGFKKDGSTESETSRSFDSTDERTPARQLKKKLNEVLQEGLLDSVLPYLLPKHSTQERPHTTTAVKKPEMKKSTAGSLEKNEKSFAGAAKGKAELKKKSVSYYEFPDKQDKKDTEVVIHVCDEIKNLKKDFKCSQKLLLSQMGYFSEVTTGQKLEDMDISVHCDVFIFEWLMKWVQRNSLSEDQWPILDSSIAVPVLMSSAFLQMNSLFEHCLRYCKKEINNVVRDSPNLGCLNDNVLTRLANLFSNTEVDKILDKKDKIQSRLFCKLIVALTEPKPQPSKGHYSSLATIYRCSKCLKLILKNLSSSILCVTSNLKMDRYGTLHSTHVYDSSWNLTDYIRDLKQTLKSWQRVYWKLWADCHFLFCQACEEYFPVAQMSWCRFHVEPVQYFPVENQRSVFHSIGRYPCCGERVYRFEVIKKISGCQYRDHVVTSKNTKDVEILNLWNFHKDFISFEPPPIRRSENKKIKTGTENETIRKSPVREGFWWEGLEIVPAKQQFGLLNKIWDSVIKRDEPKNAGMNSENKNHKLSTTRSSTNQPNQDNLSLSDSSDDNSSSSNAENSEESSHAPKIASKSKNSALLNVYNVSNRLSYVKKEKRRRKKKKKKVIGAKNEGNRFWLSKLSTRCNQDNQREFEERALKQIESNLAKKLSGESFLEKKTVGIRTNYQAVPLGGIYVKLEQDWKEAHCFSHGCPGSSIKARGSVSHVNVNTNNNITNNTNTNSNNNINNNYAIHRRAKSRGHR